MLAELEGGAGRQLHIRARGVTMEIVGTRFGVELLDRLALRPASPLAEPGAYLACRIAHEAHDGPNDGGLDSPFGYDDGGLDGGFAMDAGPDSR